ncbi:hypothetical protein CBA19CS11_30275 [Caballeronia novacaledonica]|uniref:hypothetical protein n=1 Tax=Caballeronia novacaledonica TaxID=1544861 RepID=UPI001EE38D7D|nr:hypothetical protein [Caballeronia novacaledonica]GJH13215.1 hypothetical protein CBA19CS11_30275 [Caballeronia novacaledonica]
MKPLKTLATAATLAAAGAITVVPAEAKLSANGVSLNGMVMNGAIAAGIETGQPVAVTLPDGSSDAVR